MGFYSQESQGVDDKLNCHSSGADLWVGSKYAVNNLVDSWEASY